MERGYQDDLIGSESLEKKKRREGKNDSQRSSDKSIEYRSQAASY